MKAYVAEAFGLPSTLVLKDVTPAAVPPGHVRLNVKAAGASLLDAVADDVRQVKVADRVMAGGFVGGFSQTAIVPAAATVPMPASMSFETAAGFRTNYMTALHAFRQRANLQPGETVLILGAAGGVGSAGIEIAKVMGAQVIAVASSEEKRAFAKQLGADHAIGAEVETLRDEIKTLTNGRGVDVVYDPVGGQLTELAFRSLAWRGRHLVVGFAAGSIPALPVNLALLKGAALVGVDLARFSFMHEPKVAAENMSQLVNWFESETLKPQVGHVYPFAQAREALADILARRAIGKAVVQVDS